MRKSEKRSDLATDIPKTFRLLNRDGTFNIERKSSNLFKANDLYHSLLSSSWKTFILYLIAIYFLINTFFAVLYWLLGPGALEGASMTNPLIRFEECFFFSVQTLATIGYGKLTPISFEANMIMTVQALVGLFAIALQTGLVFARFSKPTSKVVFSNHALMQVIDGEVSLLFRVANARMNQIAEATAHVTMLITEVTKEGESYRNFHDLKLERSNSPVFALSWTIVHVIDKESPLFGKNLKELADANAEIFVNITGIDETFAQTVHARMSYVPSDILTNHRFSDIIKLTKRGKVTLDISKIHGFEPIG